MINAASSGTISLYFALGESTGSHKQQQLALVRGRQEPPRLSELLAASGALGETSAGLWGRCFWWALSAVSVCGLLPGGMAVSLALTFPSGGQLIAALQRRPPHLPCQGNPL